MRKNDKNIPEMLAQKPPGIFPPRKRSIPYGFDFDLDEVWAPMNGHLRGPRASVTLSDASSSSSSSENSIYGRSLPMQSSLGTGSDAEERAATARLSGRGKELTHEDSDEFAVDNEDIFMQINNLRLASEDASLDDEGHDDDDVLVTKVGLPSARRLRGGGNIVAKGRHGINGGNNDGSLSALSTNSSNPGNSRFSSGATSPALSRRFAGAGLTPGLGGEASRKHSPQKLRSSSPRKL